MRFYNSIKSFVTEENRDKHLDSLIDDLTANGYSKEKLSELKDGVLNPVCNSKNDVDNITKDTKASSLIFNVEYFSELQQLKTFIRSLAEDFEVLVGHNNIIFATRKGASISNKLVHNRKLSVITPVQKENQRCKKKNCKTCPQMLKEEKFVVNGTTVKLPQNVDCKSKNVIYAHQCTACDNRNVYVGQTRQEFRERNNNHRAKFNTLNYEDSALASHSFYEHGLNVKMKSFKCAILKQTSVSNLDRCEFKYIENLKTLTLGLNRCKVMKY